MIRGREILAYVPFVTSGWFHYLSLNFRLEKKATNQVIKSTFIVIKEVQSTFDFKKYVKIMLLNHSDSSPKRKFNFLN